MRKKSTTFRVTRVFSLYPTENKTAKTRCKIYFFIVEYIKVLSVYFTRIPLLIEKRKKRAQKRQLSRFFEKARHFVAIGSPRHSRDFHVRPRVGISRLHHQEFLQRCTHIDTHGHVCTLSCARSLARALTRRLCPTSLLDKVVAGINWPCSPRCIPVDLLELQHET